MTTRTTMPDSYYNGFSEAKKHERVLYRDGKTLQGQELNEAQDILRYRLKNVADALFKDGDIVRDAQIAVDATNGKVQAGSGAVYLSGAVRGVPSATFAIPTTGTISVGVRLVTKIVSPLEDPTLYNPATGQPGEGEEGAWREAVETVWGFDGDGGEGEFYPVYVVDSGVVRAKETPPNLDSTTQAISKYDRDSTGGSYIVSGLQVRAAEDVEGRQVYTVTEGRARVNGYGIDIPTSRRLVYEAVPDLRRIDSEVTMADGSASQRVTVAHPPVRSVLACHITVQKTESLVHGAYMGAADTLPDTSVVEIKSVRMGETTYVLGTDYKKTGDAVDWSPAGNEPSPGSTYEVTYTCIVSVSPTGLDADGFTVSGAVKNTQITTTYDQALPRLDRLCLTSEGTFAWLKGVASESRAVSPAVPAAMLAVATVRQTWRPERSVTNGGVFMQSFSRLKLMDDRISYAINELARQRLQSDALTRESGMKSGMFVDPLTDDTMRDQGVTQTGAVFDGMLTLPITATAHALPGSVTAQTSRDCTPQTVLAQTLRTTSMQVNPYQAFEPLPATVTLNPAVDRWTENKTNWTSAVTKTFSRSTGTGGGSGWAVLHHTESNVSTEVVSSSSKEEEKVTVPDLTNKTEADAVDLANSLNLGVVNGGTEASDVIEAGKICRQDLKPGTKVDKNATITYYVSSGKETVTIPTGIVGTQKDAASAALTQLGLQVSTTEDFSDTVAEGLVISVDPSEGSQVAPESTVTLVISKGSKDAEEIAIRDVIGLDEETAKSILSDFNIIVKTGTSSKVAEGEVMEVDPAIGTKVKKGSDVTIYVNSPSAQPTTPDENTPTPTPAEPGANTATDVTWSCSQTLSAPDQYQGGIAKIELIQDDGNGNETSITIMDGQAITSWPYSVNTNWSASSSASSTGRIVFYEMDSSGSYQAIAQYPSVPLSEG